MKKADFSTLNDAKQFAENAGLILLPNLNRKHFCICGETDFITVYDSKSDEIETYTICEFCSEN